MKKSTAILWGIVLIAAGVLWGLSSLGVAHINLFFDGWWTLFLIVPAIIDMISNGVKGWNTCLLAIGVVLLLTEQNIIPEKYLGPVIFAGVLIVLGVSLVGKYIRSGRPIVIQNGEAPGQTFSDSAGEEYSNPAADNTEYPYYTAVFSGVEARNISQNFKGAKVNAVFGGAEIDLRGVTIHEDITIYLTAVFGGVDVLAPQGARISVKRSGAFGGTDCTAQGAPDQAQVPWVHFVCNSVFGGIDIK